MGREHDARSPRTRELTVEDQQAARMREAFERAQTIMCGEQAAAIARLLNDGTQGGGTKADPVPGVVAVVGVGQRFQEPDGLPLRDFLTNEMLPDPENPDDAATRAEPRTVQTIGLLAEDGRTWSVTGAGICWPGGTSFREARRGR